MIKGDDGYFSKSLIIGNDNQLTATITSKDWKYFNIGDRVTIVDLKTGESIKRKVKSIGNGKQRNITIPKEDWDLFKKGDKVCIYPKEQPKVSKSQIDKQIDDKQNDKFIQPNKQVS